MHVQSVIGDFDLSTGWVDSVSPAAAKEIASRPDVIETDRDRRIRLEVERRQAGGAAPADLGASLFSFVDELFGGAAPALDLPASESDASDRIAIDALPDAVRESLEGDRIALVRKSQETSANQYIPIDDYVIDPDALAEDRPPRQKALDNIEAIKTAKLILMAGRQATREEKAVMARYVGWGGLQYAFYDIEGKTQQGWDSIARQLQDILTPSEYAKARSTILDAHYTSAEVVGAIWQGLARMGFKGGSVMEPSCGSGNFLGLQPPEMAGKSQRVGVEIDPIPAAIAKLLYPKTLVSNSPFEAFSMGGAKFDLFVGNPPFGDIRLIDKRGSADETVSRLTTRLATSTHGYFFGRAAEGLRAGGVAAMVVSRYLLDGSSVDAVDFRAALAQEMELVDAVRLPDTAFRQNAGTEVVTDIIFLRKRDSAISDEEARDLPWVHTSEIANPDESAAETYPTIRINGWYQAHPEKVIGRLTAGRGMYRDGELMVRPTEDWRDRLREAMQNLPAGVFQGASRGIEIPSSAQSDSIIPPPGLIPGQMFLCQGADGSVSVRRKSALAAFGQETSEAVEFDSPGARERTIGMLRIYETLITLMRAQVDSGKPADEVERIRRDLNGRYDEFRREFGFIKRAVNKRLIRADLAWTLLSSLEVNYDDGLSAASAKKQNATPREPSAQKADVFTKRTQWPIQRVERADTARDALAVSLGETGFVDPTRMMELTGRDWWNLRDELGDLVMFDPVREQWVERSELVSGDVVTKLELFRVVREEIVTMRSAPADSFSPTSKLARAVAANAGAADAGANPGRLAAEVERSLQAVEAAQPERKKASEIVVLPGAHWIPIAIVEEFAKEICGSNARVSYSRHSGRWEVTGGSKFGFNPNYGTNRKNPESILDSVLNGQTPVIRDSLPDGGTVINIEQTALAKQKAEAVVVRWSEFMKETPERVATIEDCWNNTFNRMIQRTFDGSHLTMEGASAAIKLRPHQKNAIWRVIQSKATLFDHVVGAGKTFAGVGAVMESARMGRTKKAMLAVPNHLVGQWRDAFSTLYPAAKVLAAEADDMASGNRQQFLSKMAFGDWDAVIIPHSSFGLIPADPDHEMLYVETLIADMKSGLLSQGGMRSRKDVEKAIKRLEKKIESLAKTRKDEGIHFGMLGVDFLMVDEAHLYKNVSYTTQLKVSGLGNPEGSARANDMAIKTAFVRDKGGKLVFLTGTPISNTVAEMYILQKYLDPTSLQSQGIYSFDAWQRSYAEISTEFAFTLTGKLKEKTTLARYVNLEGLLGSYRKFADVITRADMNRLMEESGQAKIPIPGVRGGKPIVHVSEMSGLQRAMMGRQIGMTENGHPIYEKGSILWRLDNLPKGPPEPGADNILVIISDIKKVGLDARAFNPGASDVGIGKLHKCADNVFNSWQQYEADRGTQLVFLDFCTPSARDSAENRRIRELMEETESDDANVVEEAEEELGKFSQSEIDAAVNGDGFNAYLALKNLLRARGIPSEQIAFIHDYDTAAKRDRLFGAVNAGEIRVLMGSTSKVGAGMNVQRLLTDIHHLDAPYRPSDLEQRNGRGLRQGNALLEKYGDENFGVGIHDYVTEDSGDAGLWQIIETKQNFIEQIRTGVAGGQIENPESAAIDPATVKAMASGNEILMDEVKLKAEMQKKERLIVAVRQDRSAWEYRVRSERDYVAAWERALRPAHDAQALGRAAVAAVAERTEALRKEVEEAKAAGTKHPHKDAIDVVSRIPVHHWVDEDGTTKESASLADVGGRIALAATRLSYRGGSRPVPFGELDGVPIQVIASTDYSVHPPATRVDVICGSGEMNASPRTGMITLAGTDGAGMVGRAIWRTIREDMCGIAEQTQSRLEAARLILEKTIKSEPAVTAEGALLDLQDVRIRHQEAVMALRLGFRKWEAFREDQEKPAREELAGQAENVPESAVADQDSVDGEKSSAEPVAPVTL